MRIHFKASFAGLALLFIFSGAAHAGQNPGLPTVSDLMARLENAAADSGGCHSAIGSCGVEEKTIYCSVRGGLHGAVECLCCPKSR